VPPKPNHPSLPPAGGPSMISPEMVRPYKVGVRIRVRIRVRVGVS